MSKPSNSVPAILHFYAPPKDGSEPKFVVTNSSGSGTKNYSHNPVAVTIQDIRQRKSDLSLEQNSFQVLDDPMENPIDFDITEDVENEYYARIKNLILTRVNGAKDVFIFDYCIRKVSKDRSKQRPVRKVHVDQTPKAALERYQIDVPESTRQKYEGERVRLIYVWRPIKGPVTDHHLAVADAQTLKKENLVEIAHVLPDRVGQTYGVRYSEEQQFWYLSKMEMDEVILLLCYDSWNEGICCAHASFRDGTEANRTDLRESIEVRCLVIG